MNRNLKSLLFLIAIITCGYSTTFSQKLENDGLTLAGSVQTVGIVERDNRRLYTITLHMVFRNGGQKPLILLYPVSAYYRKIEFLYKGLGDDITPPDEAEKVIATAKIPTEFIGCRDLFRDKFCYNYLPNHALELDRPEPPIRSTLILQPGADYEFVDTIQIEQRFKRRSPGSEVKEWQSLSDSETSYPGLPISDLPALTVEYHISLAKYHKDPELLENLRRRWKQFGTLVLDSDGDFTVKSERIINKSDK